jgi:bifunctional non-homologous end joining protein LigD
MNKNSRFIVVEHKAFRAGLHYDLRFKIPGSANWASFAIRKGIPTQPGTKVLAMRTNDHSESEALFLGTIPSGEYGAGELIKWDDGSCEVLKYTSPHITINFKGNKVNGLYHFINLGVVHRNYKEKSYLFFKSREAPKT